MAKKKRWILPVAIALAAYLFLQNLFGTSSSSYVYYQSSVYESRIVGTDGKVETSRKESVKTNLPNWMMESNNNNNNNNNKRNNNNNNNNNGPRPRGLIIDRSFERELDREVESMMNDFFY
mmetsp:Transcript_31787/g.48030  ORF Transcript_31787/g.48030 Transcript_31787/m.48030 type:complete len:121 (+) Transcript_31787:667-1029(+)